ncbi:acylphosphatase-1 [Nilaparvata lugens]|uniref:acylphosphatase-1 n=1 Tax=Nilaparvata lugens TaxID=108931 RepID=UPI00193D509A|nr:acylphosphatase-1 [Nilaparvata lugens]
MATKRKLFIFIYSSIIVLIVFFSAYPLFDKFLYYNSEMTRLKAVDFEVFGKVQGVFFRKYTEEKAKSLNLVGWCENTSHQTVKGQVQGPNDGIEEMKVWLSKKGSPKSHIDKAEFNNESEISALTFTDFKIRR